jgi:leucyl-tRNA synthetase
MAAGDFEAEKPSRKAEQLTHRLIKKVEERVNSFKLNTAVSAFMEFINEASPIRHAFSRELAEQFLLALSPFAPHMSEELWQNYLNHDESIFLTSYPVYDEDLARLEEIEIAVQVNGKLRGVFSAEPGAAREDLEKAAKDLDRVRELIDGKRIRKVIVVPDKIVNFVVA